MYRTCVGMNCCPLKRCEYATIGMPGAIDGYSPWKTTRSQSMAMAVWPLWLPPLPYCSVRQRHGSRSAELISAHGFQPGKPLTAASSTNNNSIIIVFIVDGSL